MVRIRPQIWMLAVTVEFSTLTGEARPPTYFTAFFAHRACTALRALSLRSSAVMFDARTAPPSLPPLRPIFTKKSRMSGGSLFFATK